MFETSTYTTRMICKLMLIFMHQPFINFWSVSFFSLNDKKSTKNNSRFPHNSSDFLTLRYHSYTFTEQTTKNHAYETKYHQVYLFFCLC